MNYDFINLPKRINTGSKKWDMMYEINKNCTEDVVPLTVADMEFKTAPEIVEGLKKYIDESSLGYTITTHNYKKAVVNWMDKRHNFKIKEEWIVTTPGVINAFTIAMRSIAKENEGVIIFTPVYPPMIQMTKESNLKSVEIPLINKNSHYEIDFKKFEKEAQNPNNKILLFCSPHNPTTRVWSRNELEKLGKICLENNLKIISDEIWSDIIMNGYEHTVFSTISNQIGDITITCTAPSKTFNLAALWTSNIIIPNKDLRKKFIDYANYMRSLNINSIGLKACEIAYTKCEKWLDELIKVLEKNLEITKDFFEKRNMKVYDTQGTYLVWVDFSSLKLNKYDLEEFLKQKAMFFSNEGYNFGINGELYERINIAMPTEVLKNQLERLEFAIENLL